MRQREAVCVDNAGVEKSLQLGGIYEVEPTIEEGTNGTLITVRSKDGGRVQVYATRFEPLSD